MKKVLIWVNEYFEKVCCAALISLMTVILFIQVIMRRCFDSSLVWSEELARYLFIWLIYISISMGAKHMVHLKIEAFLGIFPKRLHPYILILADFLVLFFSVLIVYYGYINVTKLFAYGSTSAAMKIPMGVIYLAPIIGFLLTIVREIQVIIARFKLLKSENKEAKQHE